MSPVAMTYHRVPDRNGAEERAKFTARRNGGLGNEDFYDFVLCGGGCGAHRGLVNALPIESHSLPGSIVARPVLGCTDVEGSQNMSAPGWYPDPTDLSRQRYFDGMTWTEEYAPIGAPMTAAGQPAKPRMSKGLKIGLGTGVLALLLIALASIFSTEIKDLYAEVRGGSAGALAEKCGNGTYKLTNDRKSISFSIKESSSKEQFDFSRCILTEAGIPESVRFRIGNTRAIDGTEEADWDGWELYWNYDLKTEEVQILLSKV